MGAGIATVGQVAGAAFSGKGAKKAAKIQQKTTEEILGQTKQYYNDAAQRYQPDITQGDTASKLYAGLLGDGGDPATSQAALNTWKNSIDYNTIYNDAMKGVNANAYAAGMGRSGAALKALQDRAGSLSNGYLQTYLGDVNQQIQTGSNANAALTGAGTTSLQTGVNAETNSANAQSNAALTAAQASSQAAQNIGNLWANSYQSSYGGDGSSGGGLSSLLASLGG